MKRIDKNEDYFFLNTHSFLLYVLYMQMMKHAWKGYVKHAWGYQELRLVTRKNHISSLYGTSNTGVTIIDSLDTLYIMGLMDEYKKGREWVDKSLYFTGKQVRKIGYDIHFPYKMRS